MACKIDDLDINSSNKDLAQHLVDIAAYYALSRDIYRARTFSEAAKLISDYPFIITSGGQAKETIPRIGPSLIEVINSYLKTGTSKRLQELELVHRDRKEVVDQFLQVYGIGQSLANKYYDLGFRTLTDLWYGVPISIAEKFNLVVENLNEAALELGIIEVVEELDDEQVLNLFYEVLRELAIKNKFKYPVLTSAQRLGIEYMTDFQLKIPREEIESVESKLKTLLNGLDWVIAGSYRRGEMESGDIDILIKSKPGFSLQHIIDLLTNANLLISDLAKGPNKYMGILQNEPTSPARRIDLLVVPKHSWAYAILYFTGSQRFNILTRQRAIELGLRLSEHGMTDNHGQSYPAESEEDIFNILGIQYLAPEERTRNILNLS